MEIYQDYGNDLVVDVNGDLMTADGITLSNQRIIRRLLTTPITVAPIADYLQKPTYGAGLPQFIGQLNTPETFKRIKALIVSQMYLEGTVSQVPPPDIQIENISNTSMIQGIQAQITYTYAATNQQVVLSFSIPTRSSTN